MAHCLDAEGKPWRTNHNKDRFEYVDQAGRKKTYAPDFWQDGQYVEVKGYFDKPAQHKVEEVRRQGIRIRVVLWKDLRACEIRLFGKPQGGSNTPRSIVRMLTAA